MELQQTNTSGIPRAAGPARTVLCGICSSIVPVAQYERHYLLERARLRDFLSSTTGPQLVSKVSSMSGSVLFPATPIIFASGSPLSTSRSMIPASSRQPRAAAAKANKKFMYKKGNVVYDIEQTITKIRKRRIRREEELRVDMSRKRRQQQKQFLGGGIGSHHLPLESSSPSSCQVAYISEHLQSQDQPPKCFICSKTLPEGLEEINAHIDTCLSNPSILNSLSEDPGCSSTISTPESYTWAGQTRIRATTLLSKTYEANGWSVHKRTDEDTENEIDVEDTEDEIKRFGVAEFTEDDLRPYRRDEDIDIEGDSESESSKLAVKLKSKEVVESDQAFNMSLPRYIAMPVNKDLIIQSLKDEIKELESQSPPTCRICISNYSSPLVSTVCYHVHCEACWMQALANKRTCPQCLQIVSPKDLRRVYL